MKIFKRNERPTTDTLVSRFKALQEQKAAAEAQVDELKRRAVVDGADLKDLAGELSQLRLQVELAEAGLVEIEARIRQLLEDEVAREHESLSSRRAAYEKALSEHYASAGEALAHACALLSASQQAFLTDLAGRLQERVADIMEHPASATYKNFLDAFQGYRPDAVITNFRAEAVDMEQIERRAPGSEAAKNSINARIRELLS